MLQVDQEKEKLFKQFKNGDSTALMDLLGAIRADLYDYLMRMTGEISRSADTVDEVYQSLNDETLDTCDHWADLKSCVYATARRFAADIWNADTAKLANAALDDAEQSENLSESALRERQNFKTLDRCLKNLPGFERECLLLKTRASFDFEEIATIMATGEAHVEKAFHRSLQLVNAEYAGSVVTLEAALAHLPNHPLPPMSSQATMNLSIVMQGIKTRPVALTSRLRPTLIVILALLVGALFLFPDWFQFSWLTALISR